MNVIKCYALTNDSNEDGKDQSYEAAVGRGEVPVKMTRLSW